MNRKQIFLTASMIALLGATPLQAGWKQQGQQLPDRQNSSAALAALTNEEAERLIFMREEEKVARDVYLTLHEQWKEPIFSTISGAEQRHMDALAAKLAAYDLDDPVVDDTVGSFTNGDLANMYADLVAKSQSSLLDALYVGALIEEVDILDLKKTIAATSHPDLIQTFENLIRGSRNHLRAFVRQIENLGVPYEAQVMEPLEVDMILDEPLERGQPKRKGRRG